MFLRLMVSILRGKKRSSPEQGGVGRGGREGGGPGARPRALGFPSVSHDPGKAYEKAQAFAIKYYEPFIHRPPYEETYIPS